MLACYNITSQLHYITPAFITARAGSSSAHNIILSQLHSAICTCSLTPVMESSRYVDIQPVCCDGAAVLYRIKVSDNGR